jgi:CheY-like chemotaxis protein
MKESMLNDRLILAVDDEPDVLTVLGEEIKEAAPQCRFDKATTYHEAVERMMALTYDITILDIMGVQGFDLLNLAVSRHFPVVMLTAHALNTESLRKSIESGARAYLPKEKLGEVVPFLEDVPRYGYLPGWGRLLDKLGRFFNAHWGEDWKKTDERFWKEFDEKVAFIKT